MGILWRWDGACWDGEQHLILVIWWWEGQDGRWGLDEVNWGWCGEMQLLLQVEDWGRGRKGRILLRCRKKHGNLVMDERVMIRQLRTVGHIKAVQPAIGPLSCKVHPDIRP